MHTFSHRIRPHVDAEFAAAAHAEQAGDSARAFAHLERAHVLGQASTVQHVRAHLRMLGWGWRRQAVRECLGQLMRIVGAATKTAIGWVPAGNTGGANISPFRRLPVAPELAAIIADARTPSR